VKKILEIAKYIVAISVIGGAALYFNGLKEDVGGSRVDIMQAIDTITTEVRTVKANFDQYKKTTNTHRVYKAEQTNNLLKDIGILRRNQQAIINNSTEQKEILDEIKTKQIINGNGIGMKPMKSLDPDMLVYNR